MAIGPTKKAIHYREHTSYLLKRQHSEPTLSNAIGQRQLEDWSLRDKNTHQERLRWYQSMDLRRPSQKRTTGW
jgi:hypothetical protein